MNGAARVSLAVMFTAGWMNIANAQNLCPPPLNGVPWLPGPPRWLSHPCDAAGDCTTQNAVGLDDRDARLDDPRWNGSAGVSFDGVGADKPTSDFRIGRGIDASSGGPALFLQWNTNRVGPADSESRIIFGFGTETERFLVLLRFEVPGGTISVIDGDFDPCPSSVLNGDCGAVPNFDVYTSVSGDSSLFVRADDETRGEVGEWLQDARYFKLATTGGVMIRIPITDGSFDLGSLNSGVPASGYFFFSTQLAILMGDTSANIADNWPLESALTVGDLDPTGGFAQLVVAEDEFGQYDATGVSTACEGISIEPLEIGTVPDGQPRETAVLTNRIEFDFDPDVNDPTDFDGVAAINRFAARPFNGTDSDLADGDIRATFRLANWGSTPIVDDLPADLWTAVPNGADVAADAANVGERAVASFQWALTLEEKCTYFWDVAPTGECDKVFDQPGFVPRWRHSCLLVELTGTADLEFIRRAAYRNMSFVNLSEVSREADITIRGLPALVGQTEREVLLNIQRVNLPVVAGDTPVWKLPAVELALTEVGAAFSATIAGSFEGFAPDRFNIVDGALPSGLALSVSQGTIMGTPNQPGHFDFYVQGEDSGSGASTTIRFGMDVLDGMETFGIRGPRVQLVQSVAGGAVSLGREVRFEFRGEPLPGAEPGDLSAQGDLPRGLGFRPDDSGRSIFIAGRPQETGRFEGTITATRRTGGIADQVDYVVDVGTSDTPRFIVHVYHDSGRVNDIYGREEHVFEQQTSFGFLATHDGPLVGYDAVLDGALEPIGGDWYRVSIPNDGTVTVRVRLQARETAQDQPLERAEDWPRLRLPEVGGSKDEDDCCCSSVGGGSVAFSPLFVLFMLVVRRLARRPVPVAEPGGCGSAAGQRLPGMGVMSDFNGH